MGIIFERTSGLSLAWRSAMGIIFERTSRLSLA